MNDSDESNDTGHFAKLLGPLISKCLRQWKFCAVLVGFLILGPGLLYQHFLEIGKQDRMSELISDPLIMMLLMSVFSTVLTISVIAVSICSPAVQKKFADLITPIVLLTLKADLQNFADDGLLRHEKTMGAMRERVEKLSSEMTKAGVQLGEAGELIEGAGKQMKNAGQGSPSQSG